MKDSSENRPSLLGEYEKRIAPGDAGVQWSYYSASSTANERWHRSICKELGAIYSRKNADYGDSFHKTFVEEGMAMPRIRLTDKLERFKQLTRSGSRQVADESVRDTLMDLANYAIMTVMEMDREENRDEECKSNTSRYADGSSFIA